MKLPKTPALITGVVLSLLIFGGGFLFLQNLPSRATDQQPRDVVVSETTANSAKISYSTGVKTQGIVEYGVSPTNLNLLAPESESDTNHEIDLTLLTESTTYYFQISIGGRKYDNAGVPWTFSTKSADSSATSLSASPTNRPTQATTTSQSTCTETNCEKIKLNLGKGCTTQDYIKCIKRISPTFSPLTTP